MKYLKSYKESIDFYKSTEFHTKNNLWFGAPSNISVVEEFIKYTKNEVDTFIELGCGDLSKSIIASKNFNQVYTIEIYPPYVEHGKKMIKDNDINNIHLIEGDLMSNINNLPKKKSAIFSFLPFSDKMKNKEMAKLYIEYFPKGSYFFLIGIDVYIEDMIKSGELNNIEKIVIEYKNRNLIFWKNI